jgi:hypothetical protein
MGIMHKALLLHCNLRKALCDCVNCKYESMIDAQTIFNQILVFGGHLIKKQQSEPVISREKI